MKQDMRQIYEEFRRPLLFYIMKNISQKDLAEDLLHEVFIKAYTHIDSLKEQQNVQAWLYKIASNTMIDYFRKKQIPNSEHVDVQDNEEENESIIKELSCCLEHIIKQLPEAQQKVLQATYLKEHTLVEYASQNNLNLSTVKSHAKRGKNKLKEVFEKCCQFQKNHLNEIVDYSPKQGCNCP